MPELPEVETMRRGLLHLVGSQITAVDLVHCACRPIEICPDVQTLRRRVVGRMIADFERCGKRVLARLDDRQAIVFEPRMTGLLLVADPPDQDHLRFAIRVAKPRPQRTTQPNKRRAMPVSDRLLYWDRRGLGLIYLLTADELDERFGPTRLGPDALQMTPSMLIERLGHRRSPVKVALMDQHLFAGIGNLYASEILHEARCHPETPCNELQPRQWNVICKAVHHVLQEAIAYEGSTLSDGTYRNALNQDGGYQNHHRVYDREDQVCARCKKGLICRIVQAQRSTFFCPRCQR